MVEGRKGEVKLTKAQIEKMKADFAPRNRWLDTMMSFDTYIHAKENWENRGKPREVSVNQQKPKVKSRR